MIICSSDQQLLGSHNLKLKLLIFFETLTDEIYKAKLFKSNHLMSFQAQTTRLKRSIRH